MENKPQIIVHSQKSLPYTVYSTKWIPVSAKFVCMGMLPRGTGILEIYEVQEGNLKLLTKSEKHSAFKCGTFAASTLQERHLVTGDFDGRMSIWDIEHLDVPISTVQAHTKIINSIDGIAGMNVGHGAPEIATGSRDGRVCIWDQRALEKPVAALEPGNDTTPRDCWAVAFGNSTSTDERCVCCGYDNGDIKLFDLRTNNMRWETNVGNGICNINFDRKDIDMNKLIVTTLESQIICYDLRTFNEDRGGFAGTTVRAHDSTIWCAEPLPQNREVFATCGGNGSINLYKYKYPPQRMVKDGNGAPFGVAGTCDLLQSTNISTQPIISLDWNRDKQGLCVISALDQSVRIGFVSKLNTI